MKEKDGKPILSGTWTANTHLLKVSSANTRIRYRNLSRQPVYLIPIEKPKPST